MDGASRKLSDPYASVHEGTDAEESFLGISWIGNIARCASFRKTSAIIWRGSDNPATMEFAKQFRRRLFEVRRSAAGKATRQSPKWGTVIDADCPAH